MKKQLLIITAIVVMGMNSLNAQVSGNYQYGAQRSVQSIGRNPASGAVISNDNEVVLEVNGLVNIGADNFVAVFNIVQVGESVDSTEQLMSRRIMNFQIALNSIGIDAADIKTDMLSFVPKYNYQVENKLFSKSYNEIPAGYELQKNVSVRYDQSAKLDQIVAAAAKSEIYDLVKVDYFIPNIQKSLDSLRIKCLKEVKTRTKSYELIGLKFDTLRKVMSDNFVTVYPETRYFSYQAFSRPSLNAAKKKSSTSIENDTEKTTSSFYSHVDYDNYDIIINPVITEPVVEVSYTIMVKYFMKPDEKQDNNYYILTPSGETKQFHPK